MSSCNLSAPTMEDEENTLPQRADMPTDPMVLSSSAAEDEAAAAKVWAVYISEAEKYDKALVESWRANMEGMLIFAGLFSASLTAFLIESYKSLNPDSGDVTVLLLTQISKQLAAAGNGTTADISELPPFVPPTALLICNSLWFISLGLSLACALTATLLEQWARDFLHRADMRSAPLIRARIFSYLYYGLRRFNMHTVVEVIPLLLHASLVLFLAGLVAFLFPINRTMMTIVAILMLLMVVGYASLTVLPLLYFDCPYRTPLSGTFWHLVQYLKEWSSGRRASASNTRQQQVSMVEEMQRHATLPSAGRRARDCRALIWTVKSLSDEAELERFVDAIPDLLWLDNSGYLPEASRRRSQYQDQLQSVVHDDDLALPSRLMALLESCHSRLIPPDTCKRREISACQALWAISTLPNPICFAAGPWSWSSHMEDVEIRHHRISAQALVAHSTYRCNRLQAEATLIKCETEIVNGRVPDLKPLKSFVRKIAPAAPLSIARGSDSSPPAEAVQILMNFIRLYCAHTPAYIFLEYLIDAGSLDSPPYRFLTTKALIFTDMPRIPGEMRQHFQRARSTILSRLDEINKLAPDSQHWVDSVAEELVHFCRGKELDPSIADEILRIEMRYLERRSNLRMVHQLFYRSGPMFWSCVPRMLAGVVLPQYPPPFNDFDVEPGLDTLDAILTSLWRLCTFSLTNTSQMSVQAEALDAVATTAPSSLRTSVIVVMKTITINYTDPSSRILPSHLRSLHALRGRVLPEESAVEIPPDIFAGPIGYTSYTVSRYWSDVAWEAQICILAEFLEACCASESPYKALETLQFLDKDTRSPSTTCAHVEHQRRLGNSITSLYEALAGQGELLEAVVRLRIFSPYGSFYGRSVEEYRPWLDDSQARDSIMQVFGAYRSTLSDNNLAVAARLDELLHGLKIRHSAPGDVESGVVELGP